VSSPSRFTTGILVGHPARRRADRVAALEAIAGVACAPTGTCKRSSCRTSCRRTAPAMHPRATVPRKTPTSTTDRAGHGCSCAAADPRAGAAEPEATDFGVLCCSTPGNRTTGVGVSRRWTADHVNPEAGRWPAARSPCARGHRGAAGFRCSPPRLTILPRTLRASLPSAGSTTGLRFPVLDRARTPRASGVTTRVRCSPRRSARFKKRR